MPPSSLPRCATASVISRWAKRSLGTTWPHHAHLRPQSMRLYLVGLGFDGARVPGGLPQKLLEELFPGFGGKAITIIIMISALGAVNGLTFTGARVYATLGNDYPLFGWLVYWRSRGRGASPDAWRFLAQVLITVGMVFALGLPREAANGHNANSLNSFEYRACDTAWKADKRVRYPGLTLLRARLLDFLLAPGRMSAHHHCEPKTLAKCGHSLSPFIRSCRCLFAMHCVYMLYQTIGT